MDSHDYSLLKAAATMQTPVRVCFSGNVPQAFVVQSAVWAYEYGQMMLCLNVGTEVQSDDGGCPLA